MADELDFDTLSDDELHSRLVQRNVDADLATLLVVAVRAGERRALDTAREILA
jgi:hypothetical protein